MIKQFNQINDIYGSMILKRRNAEYFFTKLSKWRLTVPSPSLNHSDLCGIGSFGTSVSPRTYLFTKTFDLSLFP